MNKAEGMLELTTKQLTQVVDHQPEELWSIDGTRLDRVVIVGQLLDVSTKQSRVVFSFSDSTGPTLELQVYSKGDDQQRFLSQIDYQPLMYVRAVVVVKQFQSKVMYLADSLKQACLNDFIAHRYQVILGHHQRNHGFIMPDGYKEQPKTSQSIDQVERIFSKVGPDSQDKLLQLLQEIKDDKGEIIRKNVENMTANVLSENEMKNILARLEDYGYINYDDLSITLLC